MIPLIENDICPSFCNFLTFSVHHFLRKIPQLSGSRPVDVDGKFHIVPQEFEGTRRAVMIGINYVGQDGELSGCQNDCNNVSSDGVKINKFMKRTSDIRHVT